RKRASPYPQYASAAQRGYAMPCFHWPSTSIHENMWNSKSCPEGLPRQKNGVMAARQQPASTNARETGLLSNLHYPQTDTLRKSERWIRSSSCIRHPVETRLAASPVSPETGQATSLHAEQFYCIRKILDKLTAPKLFSSRCRGNLRSDDVEQTTGDRPTGGKSVRFPAFSGFVFSGIVLARIRGY